jgi:drug/metabolite transporter (DMT)-like permease
VESALGLLFVFLWASVSVAAKLGYHDTKPLTLLEARFVCAAAILLVVNHRLRHRPLPRRDQWRHLAVISVTNSAGYLGLAWLALQQISVGLWALFIAANPFLTAVLARLWLKRPVRRREWLGMAASAAGLAAASGPSLGSSHATVGGLVMAALAMVLYSVGSVYRTWSKLVIDPAVLNGWQIAIGVVLLLPFAVALNGRATPAITWKLVGALAWSVLAVSLLANWLWFKLVAIDAVRASTWLFLTPVFGYVQAAIVLGEPIHPADLVGLVLVLGGLLVAGTVDLRWRAHRRAMI